MYLATLMLLLLTHGVANTDFLLLLLIGSLDGICQAAHHQRQGEGRRTCWHLARSVSQWLVQRRA